MSAETDVVPLTSGTLCVGQVVAPPSTKQNKLPAMVASKRHTLEQASLAVAVSGQSPSFPRCMRAYDVHQPDYTSWLIPSHAWPKSKPPPSMCAACTGHSPPHSSVRATLDAPSTPYLQACCLNRLVSFPKDPPTAVACAGTMRMATTHVECCPCCRGRYHNLVNAKIGSH